jgi:hypothetical protein
LAGRTGLTCNALYEHILSDSRPEGAHELSYPEGDGFIPISPVGCLLLFASSYVYDTNDFENVLHKLGSKDALAMHKSLVYKYLDEPPLNVVDAIILIGILVTQKLTAQDLPSFTTPQDPAPSQFLEYLQVPTFLSLNNSRQ